MGKVTGGVNQRRISQGVDKANPMPRVAPDLKEPLKPIEVSRPNIIAHELISSVGVQLAHDENVVLTFFLRDEPDLTTCAALGTAQPPPRHSTSTDFAESVKDSLVFAHRYHR